jgi:hypothetical protein
VTYQVKLDSGHKEIAAALRRMGWAFLDCAKYRGLGFDFLIRHRDGYPVLLELKRPGPPSARKLTESEEAMRAMFPQFHRTAQSLDEVLRAIGLG